MYDHTPSCPTPHPTPQVMRKEKVELMGVQEVTIMVGHPRYPHGFALKYKSSKRMLLNADTEYVGRERRLALAQFHRDVRTSVSPKCQSA